MNQDLKNLQQKYAINLFDWVDFDCGGDSKNANIKVLVLGEIKRSTDKINLSVVEEKSKGIILHHKKWDVNYIGLSLKDM